MANASKLHSMMLSDTTAGQFFQNTNWFMTGIVFAWIVVLIGYIIVRATLSINSKVGSVAVVMYAIFVLVVEVSFLLFFSLHFRQIELTHACPQL